MWKIIFAPKGLWIFLHQKVVNLPSVQWRDGAEGTVGLWNSCSVCACWMDVVGAASTATTKTQSTFDHWRMDWMSIVLSIILICLVAVYFHFRRFRGSLDNGLPMVKPFLCFGSPPYRFDKIHYHKWFHEKFQQLGNTFARFDGVTPCIFTIDPLKRCQV